MKKNFLSKLPPEIKKHMRRINQPSWIPPMLATLTKDYFSSPDWIYETKFDGIRIIAYRNGSTISLMSRNKNKLNDAYPELVTALLKQKCTSFIVDGELVAMRKNLSSFEELQKRIGVSQVSQKQLETPIYYYMFDMMYIEGYQITSMPLIHRKEFLKDFFSYKDPLRYSEHIVEKGIPFFKAACKRHGEGIMAKRAQSTYQFKRSRDWLKFKCVNEQEMVIGGYTDPQGSRIGFGALLLGYYNNGKLCFAGKVGTGFNEALLKKLHAQLRSLERKQCPFEYDDSLPTKNVHWVNPKLVAQIGFEEWTQANKLRQPRYMGLRADKNPKDVVKEVPMVR